VRKRRSPPHPESEPTVILNTFIIDKKVGMISYISFIYVALVSVSQLAPLGRTEVKPGSPCLTKVYDNSSIGQFK
jgi:hypothetical protein